MGDISKDKLVSAEVHKNPVQTIFDHVIQKRTRGKGKDCKNK